MPENSDHEILVIYQTPHYEPSRREVKKDAKTRRVNDSVGAHGKYVDTSCPSDLPVGWFTHFGFGRDDGTHLTEDDLHNRGLPENEIEHAMARCGCDKDINWRYWIMGLTASGRCRNRFGMGAKGVPEKDRP